MTIELTPEQERIIARLMHSGAYRDERDVLSAALSRLTESTEGHNGRARRSRLWELRQGLSLGDVSIRELIDEGRERATLFWMPLTRSLGASVTVPLQTLTPRSEDWRAGRCRSSLGMAT